MAEEDDVFGNSHVHRTNDTRRVANLSFFMHLSSRWVSPRLSSKASYSPRCECSHLDIVVFLHPSTINTSVSPLLHCVVSCLHNTHAFYICHVHFSPVIPHLNNALMLHSTPISSASFFLQINNSFSTTCTSLSKFCAFTFCTSSI